MSLKNVLLTTTLITSFAGIAVADGNNIQLSDLQSKISTAEDNVDAAEANAAQSAEDRGQEASDTIKTRGADAEDSSRAEIDHEKRKAESAQSKIDHGKVHQIEGRWERTSFKYDRPEITAWNKDVDIPTIHVTFKNRKIAFHHPATCTIGRTKTWKTKTSWELKSLGFGIKTKVPVTVGWWDYTDIKGPCMKRAEIVTKVPEFTAGSTPVPVPQLKIDWVTVEASFDTWKVMDRDWQDELQEAGNAATAAEAQLEKDLSSITKEELERFESDVTSDVNAKFDDATAKIKSSRAEALSMFDNALAKMNKEYATAVSQIKAAKGDVGASLAEFSSSIKGVESARQSVIKRFDLILSDLEDRRATTLKRAVGNLPNVA